MFFDELNDEEWVRLSTLIANEPIRLNRRGRPRADARVVANAVLWILTTGEPWSRLPGRYPSGPTCRRRFDEWLADGTLPRMIDLLTAVSGRAFAYIPPPPERVEPVRSTESAPDSDRLRGVFWQNPESWQLPVAQASIWADDASGDRDGSGMPPAPTFAVPGAPAAASRDPQASPARASTMPLAEIDPQTDTYRGYTVYGIAQPVQNLMYRAWAEIVQGDRRVERSGLIGPRFTDAEAAEQYALDWARQWIDRHGASAAPVREPQRATVLAGLSALAAAESNIRRFAAQRGAASTRADGRGDPASAEHRELAYRVG